ncbi:MAG: HAMP domain-containing protein [Reyranella sp.]|nr:HAMP domain-containing protein [Reyranella sp.]
MTTGLTNWRSVGARLLLAFLGISAFSALVAGAAIYAFFEVGRSLELIDRRIGPILASLDVSRSAERLAIASSALSAVTTEQERIRVFWTLSDGSSRLKQLLDELSDSGLSRRQLAAIEASATQLTTNYVALDAAVRQRLQVIGTIKEQMRNAFDAREEIRRLLVPSRPTYDSDIDQPALMPGEDQVQTPSETQSPEAELQEERAERRVQQQVSDVIDGLAQVAVADQKQQVSALALRLRRIVQEMEAASTQEFDPKVQALLLPAVKALKDLVQGPNAIPHLREKELALISDVGNLLAENTQVSNQLTDAAELLVAIAKSEVKDATNSADDVQRNSTLAIATLVALSLAASALIVWLYVGRNIVARLNRLSAATLSIAGGNHEVAVPTVGRDEIAAMGEAVETFRRNTVERDHLLAERAEAADRLEHTVEERTLEMRQARDEAIMANRKTEVALTELKAAQASLIQSEKLASLGQLTAGIAHEIKNPLNFVNNFASLSNELLAELKEVAEPAIATLDADKREELETTLTMLSGNLDKIGEHGKRADNIVRSMLEHSRGATGERRTVDLNALAEEALNLAFHGARAQNKNFNITLERDYDRALAPIEVVPQDITRVFLNLIGNGFHAAHKRAQTAAEAGFRPTLRIATREAGGGVEVRVRDNGTGIAPEIRDKLFQPFFTTKPTGEGTGLGLSISYDIVTQQHGGAIDVEGEPGSFTEFIVRLPRRRPAPTAERAS